MSPYSRRRLLVAVGTIAVAGCVSDGDDGGDEGDDGDGSDGGDENGGGDGGGGDDGDDSDSGTGTDPAETNDTTTDGGTNDSSDNTDDGETTPENGSNEMTREEELERLPEPSPLSNTLVSFFKADDREAFARDRDSLRYEDGRIQVSIRLEPGGQRPEQYLPEETSGYGDTIIAFVDADDLVDLALDENVRLVTIPSPPTTHD